MGALPPVAGTLQIGLLGGAWALGASAFGWSPLQGALFDFDAELTIRGIYSGGSDDGSTLYFHWEYFNEGLNNAGFTGTYTIRARSAAEVPKNGFSPLNGGRVVTTPSAAETSGFCRTKPPVER